jgi:hypothetical protein
MRFDSSDLERQKQEPAMTNRRTLATAVLIITVALSLTVAAGQQFPIMDRIAGQIIEKYQSSTCEQLWQQKTAGQGQPKSPEEQKAISILRTDPQMRAAFIDKVAVPLANKMFECGMIP